MKCRHSVLHILTAVLLCCLLSGCFPTDYSTSEEKQNIEKAVDTTKAYLDGQGSMQPTVNSSEFSAIDALKGDEHTLQLTDWVKGTYKDGGVWNVMYNVKLHALYSDRNWNEISKYCADLAWDCFGGDQNNMYVLTRGCLSLPAWSDEPDAGTVELYNMLPVYDMIDDAYIEKLLARDDFTPVYTIFIDDGVDMDLFKNAGLSTFGTNARLIVNKYASHDDFVTAYMQEEAGKDELIPTPVETYDSGRP